MAKEESIVDIISQIKKDYGEECIFKLGDTPQKKIEVISTGSLLVDRALGVGGLPKGRIVEIYGPESSGKTTMCLHLIAEAQKEGGTCAIIDTEHALDTTYAAKLGVKVDDLYLSQPEYGEQALSITEALVRSNKFAVIVVDSVAALTPKSEIEGEMGDSVMGAQARLMSQALRKLTAITAQSGTILVFTNQLRDKIGVMFGSPETTTGGKALKFYASVRMDIRKKEAIKEGAVIVGNKTKIKVVKNKVAPPFKEVEFEIIYNEGIDKYGEVIDLASEAGIIKKGGAWYTYEDNKWQGKDSARVALKEDDVLFNSIFEKLKNK